MVELKEILEKEEIIKSLENLLVQESDLDAEIKKTKDTIIRNIGDNVFARLYTSNKRDDLEEIRDRIKGKLQKAYELRMNSDDSKYIIEHSPGKKTEINIAEYIINLNDKYRKLSPKPV